MAVHAARRHQAEHLQRAAAGPGRGTCLQQCCIVEEFTRGNVMIDAGEVLVDHAARTDVHVADFGIAHLAVGKADMQAMRVDEVVRAGRQQAAPVRAVRERDRVVLGFDAMAPAIEDQQQYGLGCGHGGNGCSRGTRMVAESPQCGVRPA
jgi:hypothetical protein